MSERKRQPIALSIAGSDSGGGAGIQADLKTFAALGVHGTTVITCLTAQNPRGVLAVQAATTELVRRQLEAVFAELPPRAVKTGMLYSRALVGVVADWFRDRRAPPLVVDPVMIATSGARLLRPDAIRMLCADLLPRARLVTPNLDEAALLIGREIGSVSELRSAARFIRREFGCAALVKGGHLRGGDEATDVFFDGREELVLSAPFVRGCSTHGTGCTYAAAITGYLALGESLAGAVSRAKGLITRAIGGSTRVGRHTALNPFAPIGRVGRGSGPRQTEA